MHFVHFKVLCLCKVWSGTVLYLARIKRTSSGRNRLAVLPGELRKPDLSPNCSISDRKVNRGVRAKESLRRVSQVSHLSISQLLLLLMCLCARVHTHTHSDFWLPSLYCTFNLILCLSRSDFWTKCFAAYMSKLIARSMVSLVIWHSDEHSQCIQCWVCLESFIMGITNYWLWTDQLLNMNCHFRCLFKKVTVSLSLHQRY